MLVPSEVSNIESDRLASAQEAEGARAAFSVSMFRLLFLAFEARDSHCATSSQLEVKRVRDLDIAEVARRSGMPASALRYYEEKGLIASIGRRGLRRLFDADVLERLALIEVGRAAGFSLDEIGRMFAPDGRPRIDRQMLMTKADELDIMVRKLSAMRDGLRHAAACPAPSHMECPRFRLIVRNAASGAPSRRRRTGRTLPNRLPGSR
jgi:DNA-binding transcriptional MerR regulator